MTCTRSQSRKTRANCANPSAETAAAFIAAGIDTKKSTLFAQSAVSAHAELMWILATQTPLGWLSRMTQFKEKSAKSRDLELLGLYAYPVLMAADILAYKATHVPVGEDQKQHLELARDIAGAFNRAYDNEYFVLPEPQILGEATRVMSLRDGTKKMSKSDESDYSRINLTDDTDAIAAQNQESENRSRAFARDFGGAGKKTGSRQSGNDFRFARLLTRAETLKKHAGENFSKFKGELVDLAVATLSPISAKMRHLLQDPTEIDQILIRGAEHASALTQKHMREIKDIVGLWSSL